MVGQKLRWGRLRMLLECEEREREREQLPTFSAKHQCLHQQYSKCNCHVQVPTLCFTTIAAAGAPAPPLHGDQGSRLVGACCYASVCTCNSTSPIDNFSSTLHFFPEFTGQKQRRHSENTAIVSFCCYSSLCVKPTAFLSQYVWLVCLPKDVDLIIVGSKSKNWTPSVQDAEPRGGFFVIKLHDLTGSFPAVSVGHREKRWREFFLNPWQWWNHRSEKVTEHQFSQNSHVLLMSILLLSLGYYRAVL